MIAALFRLAEPHGSITIDGVDILSLGLHDIRNKISIIPQVHHIICVPSLYTHTTGSCIIWWVN